ERRYAAHGVDDVLVEAGKEPKPVLAGDPVPDRTPGPIIDELDSRGVLAVMGDGDPAGLAARNIPELNHHHLEAVLHQFLRGVHARNPAAEYDHPRGHGYFE